MSNKRGCLLEFRKGHPPKGCIYPNISAWMHGNDCGCTDLASRMDFSALGVRQVLIGVSDPGKPMIDALLVATGMPYEVAFSKELMV